MPLQRKIAIAGASGLVGQSILMGLLDDPTVAEVHVLNRNSLTFHHPKLTEHRVDFQSLPPLPAIDEVYLAIGTTIRQAGSRDAFRQVDFAINLAVAQAAISAGARCIGLVSAMAAHPNSPFFYNRTKGELEEALAALTPLSLVIARPSLLLGNRLSIGQSIRFSETLAAYASKVLGPLVPINYRPIEARKVAFALLSRVPQSRGTVILCSGEMQSCSTIQNKFA